MRQVRFLLWPVCALLLASCVTVYDEPQRVVNKQSALEANVKLGMTYLQQGARDAAGRAFLNALKMDKRSAEAHQGMALVHQLNGESEMAEARFKQALKGRADFSMAGIQVSYGKFLMEEERYTEALQYFDLASKDISYPSRPEAFYLVGQASEIMGDPKKAHAAYEYALNLDARFAPAAIELAESSFNSGDYPNAKRYLDQYATNSRHSARSLWLGIRIERIFGNADKEASYALALKNLHPYSTEYLQYKKLKEN